MKGEPPGTVACGDLRRFGIINDVPREGDGVTFEGEVIAGGPGGEGNMPNLEDERKADMFAGEGKTAGFVGDAIDWLLVWDSKIRRGEGWRWGVWLGQLDLVGD